MTTFFDKAQSQPASAGSEKENSSVKKRRESGPSSKRSNQTIDKTLQAKPSNEIRTAIKKEMQEEDTILDKVSV